MSAANVTAFEDGGTSGVLDKIPDGGSRNHGRLGEVVPASRGNAAVAVDFRVIVVKMCSSISFESILRRTTSTWAVGGECSDESQPHSKTAVRQWYHWCV